jgi:TonB family protein
MKCFFFPGVILALAVQTLPTAAFSMPPISLIPISPPIVAVGTGPPGCNVAARIDGTAYWEKPAIAQETGASGTAEVKIDLSPSGNLTGEALFASSGNAALDRAALMSPRLTRFSSAIVNCRHIGGTYLYEVIY